MVLIRKVKQHLLLFKIDDDPINKKNRYKVFFIINIFIPPADRTDKRR
jgi:hypothetical protein